MKKCSKMPKAWLPMSRTLDCRWLQLQALKGHQTDLVGNLVCPEQQGCPPGRVCVQLCWQHLFLLGVDCIQLSGNIHFQDSSAPN